MKKRLALIAAAAMLLSGCGSKSDSSEASSDRGFNSSITIKAEDSSKVKECAEVAESRLEYLYPGLKSSVSCDKDTAKIEFRMKSDEWNATTFDLLNRYGSLEFRKGADTEKNADGQVVPTGELVLENADIAEASSTLVKTEAGEEYAVVFTTTDAGKDKLASATTELAGTSTPLSIWFDNEMISAPTVAAPIAEGQSMITGNLTPESSTYIAAAIDSGALPCGIEITECKVEGEKK